MGMAASQVRFLQLTRRKNDIGIQLTHFANEKVSLSREMQKVSRNYQNSLNQKILKWSNNQGVSYIDLSYQNLMKPSAMNQNKPYLLTDQSGRVVVDNQYKKYAEMISPEGKAGGDWESVKDKVIAELIGAKPEDIKKNDELQKSIWEHEFIIENLKATKPIEPTTKGSAADLLKYTEITSTGISNNFSKGNNWSEAYAYGATINLGKSDSAKNNLQTILDTVCDAVSPYFEDEEKEALAVACDNFITSYSKYLDGTDDDTEKENFKQDSYFPIGGDSSGYKVRVEHMINEIFSCLPKETNKNGVESIVWIDKNSKDHAEWLVKQEEWQKSYDTAVAHHNEMVAEKSQLFKSEQETLINFYDNIFSSIAEKGWVHNNQVNNPEYLNQMLQNNIYTMTVANRNTVEVTEEGFCNDCGETVDIVKSRKLENTYSTDIASNFSQIFIVNDSDLREQAMVEYEYEKSIINQKESRIDTRMQDLKTEQSAINQMLQGLDKVKNENIERTMNIFG